jgi:hypothetical protein
MKRIYLWIMSTLMSLISLAQEKSAEVDININKDEGNSFWNTPWVWVVGAAVFILLLVAISRGGGRTKES